MKEVVTEKEKECFRDNSDECVDLGDEAARIIAYDLVAVLELHPLVNAGGENVVTLPLLSASHKSAMKSGTNVAALVLVISQLFVTSAGTKF